MITINPVSEVDAVLSVPGSKSLTQRALIAAALSSGVSTLHGPLASEDTALMTKALQNLGIDIDSSNPEAWTVQGTGGRLHAPAVPLYLGNNGTATRFLTSVAALAHGTIHITGDERMGERPILPLIKALQGWGVAIESDQQNGCPPITIKAQGLHGGATTLPAGKSSQYVSSLLLVAPLAEQGAEIALEGELYSKPYVDMTLAVMDSFGCTVQANEARTHFVVPRGVYTGGKYYIEGDASGASYFWGAAAITGGRVTITNAPFPSLQGDAGLLRLLEQMGCTLTKGERGFTLGGPQHLQAIDVDMGNMPDVAPTLAVVAAFAEGTTYVRNIEHLRIKECDRISAVATELRKLGVVVEEEKDAMRIHGKGGMGMHGASIQTYNDHRIAMSFAMAGLRIPGVCIENENCVVKSFPDFWQRFSQLTP